MNILWISRIFIFWKDYVRFWGICAGCLSPAKNASIISWLRIGNSSRRPLKDLNEDIISSHIHRLMHQKYIRTILHNILYNNWTCLTILFKADTNVYFAALELVYRGYHLRMSLCSRCLERDEETMYFVLCRRSFCSEFLKVQLLDGILLVPNPQLCWGWPKTPKITKMCSSVYSFVI